MKKNRLFLVEKPMTRLQVLLEQRQAIEDAIHALRQYKLLDKPSAASGNEESERDTDLGPESAKKQMTH